MVKCELQVANASCELLIFCELRVALIVRVTSCPYYASCELRVERKVRVGNSKMQVETKSASCKFSFRKIKRYSKVAFQFATFFWVFFYEKHFWAVVTFFIRSHL